MEYIEYFHIIFKGIITGVLSAYLLIYGLRPAIPYPEYILEFFENKWLFIILILINYYAFIYDYRIGCLLLLSIIALVFDYVIFVNNDIKQINIKNRESFNIIKDPIFNTLSRPEETDTLNNILLKKLSHKKKEAETAKDTKELNGAPSPFI